MGKYLRNFSEWLWDKTHPESIEEKLVNAKADLAWLKQKPSSDFTQYRGPMIHFGVDEKEHAIDRKKAQIAYLTIKQKGSTK